MRRSKKLRTTIPARDGHRAGDLLDRDFTATTPNTRWVADFTYVRTRDGFVYVAFVVDVFAQRIVGWHAATTKVTDLVLTRLRIAMWDRDRHGHPVEPGTLVCHSDAGSQHTSLRDTEHLALEGIEPSIGTVGWVEWWNHRRPHSSIGQVPPAEHEQDYYAALNREPQPV